MSMKHTSQYLKHKIFVTVLTVGQSKSFYSSHVVDNGSKHWVLLWNE